MNGMLTHAKVRMNNALVQIVDDIVQVKDISIKLSREIHGLHVAREHEQTLSDMKFQIDDLQHQLEQMQSFLHDCESRAVRRDERLTEIEIA
jgi:hypothetical protein